MSDQSVPTAVVSAEHQQVSGSVGGPGENDTFCACGVSFAGFDTPGEASAELDRHIKAAEREAAVALERGLRRVHTVAALRELADLAEAHAVVADVLADTILQGGIWGHASRGDGEPPEVAAAVATVGLRAGWKVDKEISEKLYNLHMVSPGGCVVKLLAWRTEMCEQVVVGTREVTEEVPDPILLAAVPTVTVTRTEQVTRWQCKPVLGGVPAGGASDA